MECATIFRLCFFMIVIYAFGFNYSIPLEKKVIGGEPVEPGVVKYVVSYRHNGAHKCTGFLISENFVIIAAYCFHEFLVGVIIPNFNNYSVVTGILHDFMDEGKPHSIKQMIVHKVYDFDKRKPHLDIGLIELMEGIDGSEHADYCCQASYNPPIDELGYVIAWGSHKGNEYVEESTTTVLKKIRIRVIHRDFCRIMNKGRVFCAATLSLSDRLEPEDEGAPIINDDWMVIGFLVKVLPVQNVAIFISMNDAKAEITEMIDRSTHRIVFKIPRRRVTYQQFLDQREIRHMPH